MGVPTCYSLSSGKDRGRKSIRKVIRYYDACLTTFLHILFIKVLR
jgi:hypothetical protein